MADELEKNLSLIAGEIYGKTLMGEVEKAFLRMPRVSVGDRVVCF